MVTLRVMCEGVWMVWFSETAVRSSLLISQKPCQWSILVYPGSELPKGERASQYIVFSTFSEFQANPASKFCALWKTEPLTRRCEAVGDIVSRPSMSSSFRIGEHRTSITLYRIFPCEISPNDAQIIPGRRESLLVHQ